MSDTQTVEQMRSDVRQALLLLDKLDRYLASADYEQDGPLRAKLAQAVNVLTDSANA